MMPFKEKKYQSFRNRYTESSFIVLGGKKEKSKKSSEKNAFRSKKEYYLSIKYRYRNVVFERQM